MNSQDKSNHPGLDAMRNELAPPDLHAKIMKALQPEPNRSKKLKVLKFSLATIVAGALVATAVLAPRASFASAVRRVLKAIQSVRNYHVKSYQERDGQRHLMSETWMKGETRKVVLYGPDGTPLPDSGPIGEMADSINKLLQGLTPQQLLDPTLKDKLSNKVGAMGPGSGSFGMRITIDGKEVTDLPPGMREAIQNGSAMMMPAPMLPMGGEVDLTYLCGLLKDPTLWDITSGQTLNGKKVDKYQIRNSDRRVTLFIDPATSLPVRLQMKSTLMGDDVLSTDDFDYPISGP